MTRVLKLARTFSTLSKRSIEGIHESQVSSLNDSLIQVDAKDRVIGPLNKLEGHLPEAIKNQVLHRAFSVFMFSQTSNKLLIQKRALTKIAFPREWANTCCSHPLYVPEDMENINGTQGGIKRAASRRLAAELGITGLSPDAFSFKEKIVYAQLSPGGSFGESEVDYILLARVKEDMAICPAKDEVEEYQWVRAGPVGDRVGPLRIFLQEESSKGYPPTPWFNLMVNEPNCLESWWDSLIQNGASFLANEDTEGSKVRDFINKNS